MQHTHMEPRHVSTVLALALHGMHKLYRGGWCVIPEGGKRWWDEAMNGLEDRIDRHVREVRGIRVGLEGTLEVKDL